MLDIVFTMQQNPLQLERADLMCHMCHMSTETVCICKVYTEMPW